ncbi:MAG TPA: acetyl-CoA carboxylase biotin carboxyl carrier protein [Candidatus Polarisedimenticolaceae bacterium]|nr:acetyl-CoA carboxylase biotin carboxyl carrier protein [Candidatus Polarisedimenticolaceae bacterium]
MELSEDDVLHILKLIDESKFDYFQLEVGELKITVSKGEPIPLSSSPQQVATAPTPAPAPVSARPAAAPTQAAAAPAAQTAPASVEARAAAEGLLTVTAPLLGTFYIAPEPGAPPFTHVGANVTEDTTVGLIEVMKVFNSVRAGAKGTIVEAIAQNGQFVEYGQTLFLVKP